MQPLTFVGVFSEKFERNQLLDNLRATLSEFGTYRRYDESAPLIDQLSTADVLLTGWGTPLLPMELVERPDRRLKYVCHLTGEMRRIVPRAYIERGVAVTNWGDGPTWFFAEGAFTLMLGLLKDVYRTRPIMRDNEPASVWSERFPFSHVSPTMCGKTVGYVGYGAIGEHLSSLLAPFRTRQTAFDPFRRTWPAHVTPCESMETLFEMSDIVTIQCGLNEKTRGMIGRPLLERLKPGAIFINTARGPIVNEADLVGFLQARPDIRAGLDVFEREPLPAQHPLLRLDNVLIYPHAAGKGGVQMNLAMSDWAAGNIRAFCGQQSLRGVVTLDLYDRMT